MIKGLDVPDFDSAGPAGDAHVAVYLVMTAPLLCDALNETLTAWVETRVTFRAVGAVGAPTVTGPVDVEAGPTDRPLSAAIVNVYA